MKLIITALFISTLLTSCISTAKLTDFNQTNSSVNFDKLSEEFKLIKTPLWTLKTSNEYYFEIAISMEETNLVEIINYSLMSYNYHIAVCNPKNKCIIGKRGMTNNEWGSITGVYYKINPNYIQVYLNTKISQDITGSWRENRSLKIGQSIEQIIYND